MKTLQKFNLKASVGVSFATVFLAACGSTPPPEIGLTATQPIVEYGQSSFSHERPSTYLLRPSDRVSLSVFREPDFTMDNVRIGVEGNISVAMLGSIPAAGMTAKQLEVDLTRRLSSLGLRSPLVSINIVDYASHLVTVEGAVERPGVYTFQPGARLSSGIALASGPRREAKRDHIAVFRETPEGVMVAKFDHNMINQGTMLDPVLQPGDRIVIGTDGLSVFWQDVLRTIPVLGVLTLTATRVTN